MLKGSRVSDHTVPSLETKGGTYFKLRNLLISEGIIDNEVFTRNYEFNAPSAASAVILGHTSNGNVDWKTKDGIEVFGIKQRELTFTADGSGKYTKSGIVKNDTDYSAS